MPHVSLHSDGKVSIKVDDEKDALLVARAMRHAFPDLFIREELDKLSSLADLIDARVSREATESMDVTIFGPNLSSAGQRKGDLHVHAADCADCKHYGPGKKYGGDNTAEAEGAITISSRKDAVIANADHGANPDTWEQYDDLYFFPCTKELR